LVEQAVNLVKNAKKEEVKEKAEQAVEDIILDALIPPVRSLKAYTGFQSEDKEASQMSDGELNEKTRERFREKIRSGEIDDRKIEISINASSNGMGMAGGGMDEMSMINLQDMISNVMPKKQKKRKVTIAEAKKLLIEDESTKLIDMDEVKEEAIWKAENTGIIFIDEIDKIATGKKGGGGADVSREGVQRDLLPIVEGSAVNTKHGIVHTEHILFVAAGAFHVAKPSDLIPELQGRFPIRVELNSLTVDDFYRILKEPKNALTKQYEALIQSEDVSLEFTDDSLKEIARLAFQINSEVENIGARRLQTVVSKLLNDILFDIPEEIPPNAKVSITKEMVTERLSGLIEDKDLSEFML
jgi:ATP-dependent HslUV protease ATP-binding subunit HslU